jgi:hypothetical protein
MVKYFKIIILFIFLFVFAYTNIIQLVEMPELTGDEGAYLNFADNLRHGFYTTSDTCNLWYGPGYPIFIFSIKLISNTISFEILRIVNVIFLLVSFCFNTFSFRIITQNKISLGDAGFLSFIILPWSIDAIDFTRIHTESFVYLQISLIVFFFAKFLNTKNPKLLVPLYFIFGYLAITKVVFIYVGLLLFLLIGLVAFSKKIRLNRYILFFFIPVLPWLAYTYSITGKVLYPGTSGGMQLYYMTSLNPNGEGDWMSLGEGIKKSKEDSLVLKKVVVDGMNQLELDAYIKQIAVKNIKKEPFLYVKRLFLNAGRLFSYRLSRDKFSSIILSFRYNVIFGLVVFAFFVFMKNWSQNIFNVNYVLLIFLLLYIGVSLLVSAYFRFFLIMLPIVMFYIIIIIGSKGKFDRTGIFN